MKRYLLVLILVAAVIQGCGKYIDRIPATEGFTEVVFGEAPESAGSLGLMEMIEGQNLLDQTIRPQTASTVAGGAIVYAINTTTAGTGGRRYLAANSTSGNWTLPNGSYYFSIIGFDSSIAAAGCALGNAGSAVTLNGDSQSVTFSPTTAACASTPFGTGAALTALRLEVCASGETLTAITSTAASTAECSSNSAAITGVKVVIIEQYMMTTTAGGVNSAEVGRVTSGCFTPTSAVFSSTMLPPVGDATTLSNVRAQLQVQTYSGGTCTNLAKTYHFDQGLIMSDGAAGGVYKENLSVPQSARFVKNGAAGKIFLK